MNLEKQKEDRREEKVIREAGDEKAKKSPFQEPQEEHYYPSSFTLPSLGEKFCLTDEEVGNVMRNLTLIHAERRPEGMVICSSPAGFVYEKDKTLVQRALGALVEVNQAISAFGEIGCDIASEAFPKSTAFIAKNAAYCADVIAATGWALAAGQGALRGSAMCPIPGLGKAGSAVGGAVLGMGQYWLYSEAVSLGIQGAGDLARAQGRNLREKEQFAAATMAVGGFIEAFSSMGKNTNKKAAMDKFLHGDKPLPFSLTTPKHLEALDLAQKTPLLSTDFSKDVRRYVRDMENRSGHKLTNLQKLELKNALRETKFEKLDPASKAAHTKEYNKLNETLKKEWADNVNQDWPVSSVIDKKTGKVREIDHQFHHIIPQQFAGPHVWWNGHPLQSGSAHQGGVHGTGSPLNKIIKEAKEEKK